MLKLLLFGFTITTPGSRFCFRKYTTSRLAVLKGTSMFLKPGDATTLLGRDP